MAMFVFLLATYSGAFLSSDQSMVFAVEMVKVRVPQPLDIPKR